jgi:putative ABC transport system ATP-binding protein
MPDLTDAAPPAVPVLRVRDVTRWLPLGDQRVDILKGISFDVARGEWVALTGPSGSGKSTLLGLIAGLDAPSSGEVWVGDVEIGQLPERRLAQLRNERIGIVFQHFNLIPTMTARENVEAPLYVQRGARNVSKRAAELLELVGLEDRVGHRPHQLSGGQQQRVAIARALVTRPELVVADEPTGNLDTTAGASVLDLMGRVQRETGTTLVVVTHDPEVAARAGRRLHLVDGRLDSAGASDAGEGRAR